MKTSELRSEVFFINNFEKVKIQLLIISLKFFESAADSLNVCTIKSLKPKFSC